MIKKFISSFILTAYIVTQTGADARVWAASAPSFASAVKPAFEISLPADLGTVQEINSGSGPVIVQIQTAHGSFEAQKNIKAILSHLKKSYGFDLLLLEGSGSKLYPGLLEFFPGRNDLNQKAAEELAHKSLVKGDELFLLEEKNVPAYGLEDIPLYLDARKNFKEVLLAQETARDFLSDLSLQIERMTAVYLNPDLRGFLETRENFEKEKIPFSAWIAELTRGARKTLQTDFLKPSVQFEWPMMARVAKMKEFEPSAVSEKLNEERKAFREEILKLPEFRADGAEKLIERPFSHSPAESARAVEEIISALPDDFPYENYPNLRNFFGYLVLQSEIKPELLHEELERVSERIVVKLSRSENERVWSALLKKYHILERLLALELTPAAYDNLLKDTESFRPSVLARSFDALNSDGRVKNFNFGHLAEIDLLFEKSLAFYQSTKDRDRVMLQNIQSKMKESAVSKAVVITGGFHAPAFKDYFISRGFNYALISPKITSVQGREEYLASVLQTGGARLKKSAMDLPRRMETPAVQTAMGEDMRFIDAAMNSALLETVRSEMRSEKPAEKEGETNAEENIAQTSSMTFDLLPSYWRYKRLQRVSRLWRPGSADKYGLLKYLMTERYVDIPGMRDFVIRIMGYFTKGETKSFNEAAGELIAAYRLEEMLAADYDVEILALSRIIGAREFDVMFFIRPKAGKVKDGKGNFLFEEGIYFMEAKEDPSASLQPLIRETVNEQVSHQLLVLRALKLTGVPVKGVIVAAGGPLSSRDKTRKAGEFQTEALSASARKNSYGAEREITVVSVVTESFDVPKTAAPADRVIQEPSMLVVDRWYRQQLRLLNLFAEILGPRFGLTVGAEGIEGTLEQRASYRQLFDLENRTSETIVRQIKLKQEKARNFEAEYQIRETEADRWAELFDKAGAASLSESGEILDWYFLTNFKRPLPELTADLEQARTGEDLTASLPVIWAWVKNKYAERNAAKAAEKKAKVAAKPRITVEKRVDNNLFGPYGWVVVFANHASIQPVVSETEAERVLRDYFRPAVDADDEDAYRKLNKTLREEIVWRYGADRQKAWDELRRITTERAASGARQEVRIAAGTEQEIPLSGPILGKDLDELKKIRLTLKNVKESGPTVSLEFRGDKVSAGDELLVIVWINGKKSGDFHLLNRPDLLRIGWVYPFMGLDDPSSMENSGVMSTIVNWIAWEAARKNAIFENSGTSNLKLIYLYSKYFELFTNDYGLYDSRNVGSVDLQNKSGRVTARSVAFESVSSQPGLYRIISRRNLSSELNGPGIFEIGSGGQLIKVEDTGTKVPLNYYMEAANRSLIVGGKVRSFTVPSGTISARSEIRASLRTWGKVLLAFAAVTFVLVLINQIIIQIFLANQSQLMVGVDRPDLELPAREHYEPSSKNYPEGVKILVKTDVEGRDALFNFIFHYVEDSKKYIKAVFTIPLLWIGVYLGVRLADYIWRISKNRILSYFNRPQSVERYSVYEKLDKILKLLFWASTFGYMSGLILNGADVFFYHAVADYIRMNDGAYIASPGDFLIWGGAIGVIISALFFGSRMIVETFSFKKKEEVPPASRSEVRSVVRQQTFDLKKYNPAPQSPKHVIVHMDSEYQTALTAVRPAVEKIMARAGAQNTFEIVENSSVLEPVGQTRWVSDPRPVLGGPDSQASGADPEGEKAFDLFVANAEEIILTGGFCNSCHEEFFTKIIAARSAEGKRTVLHLPADAVYFLFENLLKPETFNGTDYFKTLTRFKSAVFFDGKLFWSNSPQPQVIINIWGTMPEWKARSEARSKVLADKLREDFKAAQPLAEGAWGKIIDLKKIAFTKESKEFVANKLSEAHRNIFWGAASYLNNPDGWKEPLDSGLVRILVLVSGEGEITGFVLERRNLREEIEMEKFGVLALPKKGTGRFLLLTYLRSLAGQYFNELWWESNLNAFDFYETVLKAAGIRYKMRTVLSFVIEDYELRKWNEADKKGGTRSEVRLAPRSAELTGELKARLKVTGNLFPLEWVAEFGREALMKALSSLGLSEEEGPVFSEADVKSAKKFLGIENSGEIPDAFILGSDLALNNGGLVLIDTFLKDSAVAIAADSDESYDRLAAYNKERAALGKKPVPVVRGIAEAEKVFAGNFKNGVNLYGFASPDEISEEWARILKDKLQVFTERRMEIFAETFGISSLLESFKARFAFAKSA